MPTCSPHEHFVTLYIWPVTTEFRIKTWGYPSTGCPLTIYTSGNVWSKMSARQCMLSYSGPIQGHGSPPLVGGTFVNYLCPSSQWYGVWSMSNILGARALVFHFSCARMWVSWSFLPFLSWITFSNVQVPTSHPCSVMNKSLWSVIVK